MQGKDLVDPIGDQIPTVAKGAHLQDLGQAEIEACKPAPFRTKASSAPVRQLPSPFSEVHRRRPSPYRVKVKFPTGGNAAIAVGS